MDSAILEKEYDGRRVLEWRENGRYHRLDGPARIVYYSDGKIKGYEWFKEGVHHRRDGPAWVEYYSGGGILQEFWYIRGKNSRIDGPAWTLYYPDGGLRREDWRYQGKSHRYVYPSLIEYDNRGKLSSLLWYNWGVDITRDVLSYLRENDLRDPLNISLDHSIIMKMKFW